MYRILYVDDEPGLLEIGKSFLERSGDLTVSTLDSAQKGLDALRIEKFDAIISDYLMPGMDGLSFLKEVRQQFGTIPFILFTGKGREEVVIAAINNGADFYLQKGGEPKPQFAELAHRVRLMVQQKKAEEIILDHERQESDIFSFLPDATFAIDKNGTVISWNHAMEEMTGVPAAQILGKGNNEYAVPFYGTRRPILIDLVSFPREEISKMYTFVDVNGDVLTAETVGASPLGKNVILWGKAAPLYDREGNVTGAIESIRDISDRRRAEEALHESERQYRDLFENSVLGIFRTTPEGTFSTINPTFARMSGYETPDEMMKAIRDVRTQLYVNPSDRTLFMAKLVADGFVKGYEARFYRKDGHILWIALNAIAVRNPEGKVQYFEGTIEDITERKRAQEDLRESENRYRTIFENTGTATVLIEENTLISIANAEFEQLSGYAKEELEDKKSWTEFVVKEDLEKMLARHRQRRERQEGALKNYEFRFVTKTGEIRNISLTIDIIPGTKKSVASLMDITKRKQAEEALQKSETKFRELSDFLPQIIFEFDVNANLTYVNKYGKELFGLTEKDLENGLNARQLVIPEDIERTDRYLKKVAAGEKLPGEIFTLVKKDKSLMQTILVSSPIIRDGRLEGFRGSGIDITERIRLEEALAESEEKYRALAENSADVLFSTNIDGIITFASPQVNKYGFLVEEVIGKPLRIFIHPADIDRVESNFSRELKEEAQFVSQFRILDKWGTTYWFEEKSTLRLDLSGKPIGIYGILRDVTERKQVEDAIEIANKKLNLMNQITRHDIINTITGLLGCVDMAKATNSPEEKEQLLSDIRDLTRVIQRHITFTREYQEIGVQLPQWQNLNDLIDKLLQNFVKCGITFSSDFEKTEIYADPLLEKVFYNLIENAVRYGGKITTIRFSVEERDGDHVIVCEDDGVGVPHEEKEQIFERGFGKNTGLGLFLAREILDITGITIRENGEPGKGAQFEITVPKGGYR